MVFSETILTIVKYMIDIKKLYSRICTIFSINFENIGISDMGR